MTQSSIVIPFSDDSTLIFALRMRACLEAAGSPHKVDLAWFAGENALSERQMAQLLPEGADMALTKWDFETLLSDPAFHAVITSRVFRPLAELMEDDFTKARAGRACVVAFLGGLDFFPNQGYARRKMCDAVYVFPKPEVDRFDRATGGPAAFWREVRFGHPTFLRPEAAPAPQDGLPEGDIYFFAQAISPPSREGRLHLLRILRALAWAHPERDVYLKLRHLPGENARHLHQERFAYPDLLGDLGDIPPNLKITADTMEEVLPRVGLGITCTSTAAIDLVRAGVPTQVYLDFADAFLDPLVAPMRRLFAKSGLIASLEDVLALRAGTPDPDWLEGMFCPRDLGADVLATIERFHGRAFQAARHPGLEAARRDREHTRARNEA